MCYELLTLAFKSQALKGLKAVCKECNTALKAVACWRRPHPDRHYSQQKPQIHYAEKQNKTEKRNKMITAITEYARTKDTVFSKKRD